MTEIKISLPNLNSNIHWPETQMLPTFSKVADVLDFINSSELSAADQVLIASLKGIVNSTKPRIFTFDGDEGNVYCWLNELDLKYEECYDAYKLVEKYISEARGIVIYDPDVKDTLNLATTIAGVKRAIIVSPENLEKVKSLSGNLEIVEDLRGRFSKSTEVYEYLYEKYWPLCNNRVIVGLDPDLLQYIREYCIAINSAAVWLDSQDAGDAEILKKFLNDMPDAKALYLGWWKDEGSGVAFSSRYGVSTVASDYCSNLTVFSGMSREIDITVPPKPALENKLYITMIMSDGDNLQYMQRRMRTYWDDVARGDFPLAWTIAPTIADAAPAIMNWFHKTSTLNDSFMAGPSGLAYNYVGLWQDKDALCEFMRKTDEYCSKTGARTATIWDGNDFNNKPSMDEDLVKLITENLPTMLGVTQQIKGKDFIRNNTLMTSLEVPYTYTKDLTIMKNAIDAAFKRLSDKSFESPEFLAMQACPWTSTPGDLKEIADYARSLGKDVVLVRIDHYFMLMREYYGLDPQKSSN